MVTIIGENLNRIIHLHRENNLQSVYYAEGLFTNLTVEIGIKHGILLYHPSVAGICTSIESLGLMKHYIKQVFDIDNTKCITNMIQYKDRIKYISKDLLIYKIENTN